MDAKKYINQKTTTKEPIAVLIVHRIIENSQKQLTSFVKELSKNTFLLADRPHFDLEHDLFYSVILQAT